MTSKRGSSFLQHHDCFGESDTGRGITRTPRFQLPIRVRAERVVRAIERSSQ
jgi:hypothetical protein